MCRLPVFRPDSDDGRRLRDRQGEGRIQVNQSRSRDETSNMGVTKVRLALYAFCGFILSLKLSRFVGCVGGNGDASGLLHPW